MSSNPCREIAAGGLCLPLNDYLKRKMLQDTLLSRADTIPSAGPAWLVLLAAGQGARLRESGLSCPKQFISFGTYPLYWHSALTAARVARLQGVVFVLPENEVAERGAEIAALAARHKLGLPFTCVAGSPRLRQESVAAGLAALPPECARVLIHDAARPLATPRLYNAVLDALEAGASGAIPGLGITDTVKQVAAGPEGPNRPGGLLEVRATLPREELVAVQTPQGFNLAVLRKAHARAAQEGWEVTDDAALLERCGYTVAVTPGEADNRKITTPEDLDWLAGQVARLWAATEQAAPGTDAGEPVAGASSSGAGAAIPMLLDFSRFWPAPGAAPARGAPCTGFGYDVHRYVAPDAPKARPMKLGGVPIAGAPCVEAHSDGDVLLHALMDALLGCLALGDIGVLFPDTDASFAGMDSAIMLSEVLELARRAGLAINHVDVTIIAQTPKISPHRELIHKNLCALLQLAGGAVNVKATTEERLGFTGRKEGIKAVAVVSAVK